MLVCVATCLYSRAKESIKSTAVAAGRYKLGSQNDEGEKSVFAVANKMNY